jgi:hypothetical protein
MSNSVQALNTSSALPLCKVWFQECLESHESCKSVQTRILPTRLIKIDGLEPKLCLSVGLKKDLQYATLSHCWGSIKFLTLTKATFEEFQNLISPNALSKTFRDAIYIAQQLGLKYIWIDSLCIIQDDRDDWKHESTLMTSVYGNSTINIAATSAVDGSVGCFFDRPSNWRCQIRTVSQSVPVIYECFPASRLDPRRSTVPLWTRGWVVQEDFLPRRTLHFFNEQVFWNCHHTAACEIFASELYTDHVTSFCKVKKPISLDMWHSIVSSYSGCKVTKTEDRLVAIAGLAQLIYEQTKIQYVAGMWRNSLVNDLRWFVVNRHHRIKPYVAPSWSWASVLGKVNYLRNSQSDQFDQFDTAYIEVLDVHLSYATENPFGELSGASLQLRCDFLLKGVVWESIKTGPRFTLSDESVTVAVSWDYYEELHNSHQDEVNNNVIDQEVDQEADSHVDEDIRSTEVFILPTRNSHKFISGLLIQPTGEHRGQYRRLAFFNVYSSEANSKFEALFANENCWARSGDFVDCEFDSNGKRVCVIDMI